MLRSCGLQGRRRDPLLLQQVEELDRVQHFVLRSETYEGKFFNLEGLGAPKPEPTSLYPLNRTAMFVRKKGVRRKECPKQPIGIGPI